MDRITHRIYLTSESRVIEALRYPADGGPKVTYRYVDADKDGRVDYALLTGGRTSQALVTRECRESDLYPKVFGDLRDWRKAIVGNSPLVQKQFRTLVSSARETFRELETALKENRVEPRGSGASALDVHDAQGNTLFEIRVEEHAKPNGRSGQLELTGITIVKHDKSVVVKDADLLRPLEAKLREVRYPNEGKQPTRHASRRNHLANLQSARQVANRKGDIYGE